jgi:replicative DNA helicase
VIYSAILDVHGAGAVCDIVTVGARLKETNSIEKVGGFAYLSNLCDNCPSSVNIEHYAKIVKDKAARREVIEQARKIASAAQGMGPIDDIPTRLSIETYRDAEINNSRTIIKRLTTNIEKGYPGLPPCYDLLARTIRKVSPGHLWVVAGYTSTGKTAWLVDFICRQYRYGMANPGIAIFSTEMSEEQYMVRILSNQTKIPGWTITEKKLSGDQYGEVAKAQVFYASRNLYIYDRLYKIAEIERTARMLKEKNGLDILAIDYIQNLWGEGKIYDRMSTLAPVLQYLAKELQVTIIALSQVSNQHVREKGSGVYGYKGAGEIAASADLGIELTRDPEKKEMMPWKVEKNRHGRLGEGCLEYIHDYTKLHEVVDEETGRYGG